MANHLGMFGLIVTLCLGPVAAIAGEGHEHNSQAATTLTEGGSGKAIDKKPTGGGHHTLVHPFLTHMGLPDGPGEFSIRGNGLQESTDGEGRGDLGVHVEAGIVDRWGLHVRNDAIRGNPFTELMLQYAFLRDASKMKGISVFGQLSFPTAAPKDENPLLLYGVSGRWVALPYFSFDANIHHNVSKKKAEWETAIVYHWIDKLFPVLEVRGEFGSNENVVNMLPALKFRMNMGQTIGIGYQFPVTSDKEFDTMLLVQLDIAIH